MQLTAGAPKAHMGVREGRVVFHGLDLKKAISSYMC